MSGYRALGAAVALVGAAWLSALYSIPGDGPGWRHLLAGILIYGGCRFAFTGPRR